MTRRDYLLISKALREARTTLNADITQGHPATADDAIYEITKELARAFKRENASFDSDRFWAECYR